MGGTGVALATLEDNKTNVLTHEDVDAIRELEVGIARFTPRVDVLISLGERIQIAMQEGHVQVGDVASDSDLSQRCDEVCVSRFVSCPDILTLALFWCRLNWLGRI